MNYLCIQFSNFRETQSLLDMIDIFKNTEIVIFNQQKIRGLKHKAKIHFLSFEKFKDFLKITKKQDKIFFIDNKINYIFPKSFTNTIKNHKYNSISIFLSHAWK